MTTYEIPNINYDHSGEYFVHYRPLGKKIQGYYPNVTWSDIAIQNVPLETTIQFKNENELSECLRSLQGDVNGHIMVGNKKEDSIIIESSSYKNQKELPERGEKPRYMKTRYSNRTGERSRVIPSHMKKKYPTKPLSSNVRRSCKYPKYM